MSYNEVVAKLFKIKTYNSDKLIFNELSTQ